jgi:hypothetical protein
MEPKENGLKPQTNAKFVGGIYNAEIQNNLLHNSCGEYACWGVAFFCSMDVSMV